MISYSASPVSIADAGTRSIANFVSSQVINTDAETVKSFGEEWSRFNNFSAADLEIAGSQYFDIVNDQMMNINSIVLDAGCGTGRWSKFIAGKVKFIEAVDPSEAVFSAAKVLNNIDNVRITRAGVEALPFPDQSFDFVFSLGVLHHIPDTAKAIKILAEKLKPGGYMLLYLYYRFDNRSFLFKLLFAASDLVRKIISRLPQLIKPWVCDLIAVIIYLPVVSFARLLNKLFPGSNIYRKIPLSYYVDKSFYIMRNDSLDRFGTPLEQRFTRNEIREMMQQAGMSEVKFSDKEPYWHFVSRKK